MKIFLKQLISEGQREDAAIDYLSNLVKSGPFNGRVYLAGGAPRDLELGISPKDLDVVVRGDINAGMNFATWAAQQMGNYKEGSNPVLFPNFGTAKFTLDGVTHNGIDLTGMEIEAVAPRKEKYTAGSRKPTVSGGELEDDVMRRDFTVNSLLKDLTTGEILDLTGKGKEDIKKGIIQTPLNPDVIFTDDPLRILRAVRFAIKYDWDLPMFMLRGMKKNSAQLKNISQERIRDELNKMLLTGSPQRAIKLMKSVGVLEYVIPELKSAVKMTQNVFHKNDVFDHTLDVLSKTQPVLIQRLMGLFHDIGKTVTKSVTPTGVHFYGHEMAGEKMVKSIMTRLKYPTELIDAVALGVRNHMRLKSAGDDGVTLSDKALRKFKIEVGEHLENILGVIHADNTAHADAHSMPNQIANVKKRLDNLNMTVKSGKPKLPITGEDLKALGLKPGPIYSKIFSEITEKWYDNPNLSKEEALQIAKSIAGI
jgi:poly(A) polymerase